MAGGAAPDSPKAARCKSDLWADMEELEDVMLEGVDTEPQSPSASRRRRRQRNRRSSAPCAESPASVSTAASEEGGNEVTKNVVTWSDLCGDLFGGPVADGGRGQGSCAAKPGVAPLLLPPVLEASARPSAFVSPSSFPGSPLSTGVIRGFAGPHSPLCAAGGDATRVGTMPSPLAAAPIGVAGMGLAQDYMEMVGGLAQPWGMAHAPAPVVGEAPDLSAIPVEELLKHMTQETYED